MVKWLMAYGWLKGVPAQGGPSHFAALLPHLQVSQTSSSCVVDTSGHFLCSAPVYPISSWEFTSAPSSSAASPRPPRLALLGLVDGQERAGLAGRESESEPAIVLACSGPAISVPEEDDGDSEERGLGSAGLWGLRCGR